MNTRQMESVQRLIDRRREEQNAARPPTIEPVTRGTKLTVSILLALASPASLLPIFAGLALLLALLVRSVGLSAVWAVTIMLVIFTAAAWKVINGVIAAERPHPLIGNRRFWPLLATLSAVALTAYELYEGGDVDLVIFVWVPIAFWWSWCLLMSLNEWHGLRVARWFLLPLCVVTIASARVTHGFFQFRFDASVDELTRAAQATPEVSSGTYGSFTIIYRRPVEGCQTAFRIKGWWVDDHRTIAYCPKGKPSAYWDPVSLGHHWYDIRFYTD